MSTIEEPTVKRILVNKSGPFPQAARVGFQAAGVEATRAGAGRIIMLVPSRQGFEATVPGEFLGRQLARELLKKGSVSVPGLPTIELHTPTTFAKVRSAEVLLAFYADPAAVENACQSLNGLRASVFVPWMPDELTQYQQLLNPVVLEVPDEPTT